MMKLEKFCTQTLCAFGLMAVALTGCKTEDSGDSGQADAGAGGATGGATGGAPVGGQPSGGAPAGGEPAGGAPAGGAPVGGAPVGGAPAGGAPVGGAPVGGAPVGGAPVGGAPVGGAPVGGAPVGGAPVGGAPVGGAPVGGAPVGGAPVGGAPVGGAPVGGAPVGGALVPVAEPSDCAAPIDFVARATLNDASGLWTFVGNTDGAADTSVPRCGTSAGAGDATFAFTAPAAGTWFFTTVPVTPGFASYDTILSLRSDCADVTSTLDCNDDSTDLQSAVATTLEAGQTVYVVVDGYQANSGPFELTIGIAPVAALGEACGPDAGFAVCPAATLCYDESFFDDVPAVCSAQNALSTGDACDASSPLDVCPEGDLCFRDVCTTVQNQATGDACERGNPTTICPEGDACFNNVCTSPRVLNTGDACEVGSPAVCPDGDVCFDAVCTTPRVLNTDDACVAGSPVACGPSDECVAGVCVVRPNECPAEYGAVVDLNANPGAGANTWVFAGNTANGLLETACARGVGNGAAVVHSFLVPADGEYSFETRDMMLDTVVYVRASCGYASTELVCDDDAGAGNASLAQARLTAGQTVYVFVDGFSERANGAYTLTVSAL